MNRREALTLAGFSLVTVAVGTLLGLLVCVANVGRVQWAEVGLCGAITALALLLPTTLVLLLRAAWLGGPGVCRAVRERVREWRLWRGIQLAAEPQRPTRDTMAVGPRAVHAHAGRHAAGGTP